MKRVLSHIGKRRRSFESGSFFKLLRDESRTVEERLTFMPAMAHFILSFADLNRYVLPYSCPKSELEYAVNEHAAEDSQHWPWYLEDLKALGFDDIQTRTAWLSDCWSEETRCTRILSYRLVELAADTTPAERIALMEVMEETGNAVFTLLASMAADLEEKRGIRLRFCGEHHLKRESGHVLSLDSSALERIRLEDRIAARAVARVDKAFSAFDAFLEAMHAYAVRRLRERNCDEEQVVLVDERDVTPSSASRAPLGPRV